MLAGADYSEESAQARVYLYNSSIACTNHRVSGRLSNLGPTDQQEQVQFPGGC
jgi:hypothetical protein